MTTHRNSDATIAVITEAAPAIRALGIFGRARVSWRPAWSYVRVTFDITATYGESMAQDAERTLDAMARALQKAGHTVVRMGDEIRVQS